MRCLLIDNYDSFTWNLADYIGRAFGEAPVVVRNDAYSWAELCAQVAFDCIVVSPGPGSVTRNADFHVSRDAVTQNEIPVFGVCLGFQGIAHAHGGRIAHAPQPFHGRPSPIIHAGDALFAGIPSPFSAIRYHSLIAASPLPPDLVATAHTPDGVVMALRHRELPKWGVQFHPESILTECGIRIIGNFRDLAQAHRRRAFSAGGLPRTEPQSAAMPVPTAAAPAAAAAVAREPLTILAREVQAAAGPEAIFAALFAGARNAFWLDSQAVGEDGAGFSFLGMAADEDLLRYRLDQDTADFTAGQALLARMDEELQRYEIRGGESLPFAFRGGFVGLLSYEMKALFGGGYRGSAATPDALWLRARRFVAYDHAGGRCWVVAAVADAQIPAAEAWLSSTAATVAAVRADLPPPRAHGLQQLDIQMDLGRDDYLAAIAACQQAIVDGESYEVCLTTRFSFRVGGERHRDAVAIDAFALYRALRAGNAAPFGAFLRCGDDCVLSTSPERFLRVDAAGRIQAKPIKGTRPRGEDREQDSRLAAELEDSVKEQAENLMIVDLLRNDLNRVSVAGSVQVPRLRVVETYRTVHQLVSTIESRLREACSLMDLLRAAFPGGSISGAPKLRTLEIIDRLEPQPRGAYCGSVGYLGYGRVADLNIAIRTVSCQGADISFGAGGAITCLSDPAAEFQETLLKAEAVLRPLWRHLGGEGGLDYELDHAVLRVQTAAIGRATARRGSR